MIVVGSDAPGTGGVAGGLLTELDHVGIAVRDLDNAVDYYASAFGATVAHREIIESDGVEEALLSTARNPYLDTRGVYTPLDGYGIVDAAAALHHRST